MRHPILFLLPVAFLSAQQTPRWPDTFVGRLESLAVLETLNAELLAGSSATLTLETWCRDHRLAPDARIIAVVEKVAPRPATPEQRRRLEVADADELRYRRVQLRCGDRVLSKAENWYVPARLSAEMNRLLDTTDTPFGRAVQPLEPYRRTFAAKLLWSPLPEGWDRGAAISRSGTGALTIPEGIFEHRALLFTREHKPFAEVDEVYQGQLLAFDPPRL